MAARTASCGGTSTSWISGTGTHLDSIEITGYFASTVYPNTRDVCGIGTLNDSQVVHFRVRLQDNGEPGQFDQFGLSLSTGLAVSTRLLGNGRPGGGNVQLHEPNPSTTGPEFTPDEFTACGGVTIP